LGNEGTQILFDFTVIDCDQDLMQALVNSAASALLASKFQLKCIPTAICILRRKDGFKVDPSLSDIQGMRQEYSHKLFAVLDSQKDEFIYSSLMPLSWRGEGQNQDALDLEEMEKLMGLANSCCKKMHEYVVDQ
jgi:ribonuclease PH